MCPGRFTTGDRRYAAAEEAGNREIATLNVAIDGSWLQRLADFEASPDQPAEFVDAGFTDQSHLTHTFAQFTAMTPGRYRTFLGYKPC